jgi:hypothetical protein
MVFAGFGILFSGPDITFMSSRVLNKPGKNSLVGEGAHAVRWRAIRSAQPSRLTSPPSIMGPFGPTPQSASCRRLRVQPGRSLILRRLATAQAGAFALVVQCVPGYAQKISTAVRVPKLSGEEDATMRRFWSPDMPAYWTISPVSNAPTWVKISGPSEGIAESPRRNVSRREQASASSPGKFEYRTKEFQ